MISPLTAEALAVRAAMKHALELGFTSLQIQSDSQDLIRTINRNEQLKEIIGIMFDIKAMFLVSSVFLSSSFLAQLTV